MTSHAPADEKEDSLLEMRTVQGTAVKSLIEILASFLSDVNWTVTPGEGLKLLAMDQSKVSLSHAELDAVNFESFYCEGPMVLGLNMSNLFKLIKSVTSNDVLSQYVRRATPHKLGIRIDSNDQRNTTIYNLKILDLDSDKIVVPLLTMNSSLSMASIVTIVLG
jgi:proliferating cell nuclear antigen